MTDGLFYLSDGYANVNSDINNPSKHHQKLTNRNKTWQTEQKIWQAKTANIWSQVS